MTAVVRLYPPPAEELPLNGTYLAHDLRATEATDRPFVYTNFVSSLDGRISERDPETGRKRVPAAIANARDWRLYLELSAQADVLLTTAGHLRAVAAGRHGDLLSIADQSHPDLVDWRAQRGLPPHAVCVAVSDSLQLPVEALRERHPGPVQIITSAQASRERIALLERNDIEVVMAGKGPHLDGREIIDALGARGYRYIYSIAGPRVMHALLAADVLDRLYLTLVQLMLGGERYDSLTCGAAFASPRGFDVHELYFDPYSPQRAGQFFVSFDRTHP